MRKRENWNKFLPINLPVSMKLRLFVQLGSLSGDKKHYILCINFTNFSSNIVSSIDELETSNYHL